MGAEVPNPLAGVRALVAPRRATWAAVPMAALLAVTLLGYQPSLAGPTWTPPAAPEVTGVAAVDAPNQAARAAWSAGAEQRSIAGRGPQAVAWPVASTATVDLPASTVRSAGAVSAEEIPAPATSPLADTGLAVRVGRPDPGLTAELTSVDIAPARVTVAVRGQDQAVKAGVRGLLFSLARPDNGAGPVRVDVNYASFAAAYGGDWSSRLRLVSLPACAATTPHLAACQVTTPVASRNDPVAATVTGEATVAAGAATMLALAAAPSGDNGDFNATTLSPASTWQVSPGTGGFSWSYPLRMVPGPGGPAPELAFAYSSGAVDGRTATSNNQGGWVGDGWDAWPGFVERSYQSCVDDNPTHKTGDQCWFNDNATLSLGGHSGELIQSGGVWRLKDDDGTKVEKVTAAARDNGDNDNEYWKVTTVDGTQYFFGYHRLPGWVSTNPVTNSVWTVPVYGNNSGEPCHNATFANAYCDQAWRWNLDYVVDPHGTTMAYYYGKETGAYGRNLTASQRTTYDRGGYLERIEYGMRQGGEYSQAAPVRVVFTTAERCLSGCWSGAAWTSNAVASAWPDTPWDQYCKASPCTDQLSPTFWSARRLAKVTTQVRTGTASYADVESWALRHEFPNAGTGEGAPMWLRGITRTGAVTSAGGAAAADPEVTFDPGAEPLPNRVDAANDNRTSLNRWRIKNITTESGGQILVTYSPVGDCTRSNLPTPATNATRCMPAFYALNGTPTLDWFHKYVVTRVDLDDIATDQINQTTFYDYLDAPAWHYNTDEITKDKYRTWGDWRGYGRVQVRQGDPSGIQTAVEYRYLRGMDGDRASASGGTKDVWVDDTWGGRIEDHEALQGVVRQEITLNGSAGAEVSSTISDPWKSGPTATRTRGGITTNSWLVDTAVERTRTALAAGGFRTTRLTNAFNGQGLPTTVEDGGDEAVTGDESCTRTTYARNDTAWMIDTVAQQEVTAGPCSAAVTPASVLSRTRTFYDTYVDESSFGSAPTKGDEVRTEELGSWNGNTPIYVPTTRRTYDSYGRVTAETDAGGNTMRTAYTTTNGGLVTATAVTNPLGHVETTYKEPAWDEPVKIVDENGGVSELTYDGLGRLTAAWLPGRSRATQTANVKFGYLMRNAANQPTAVTTENLLPTGAGYRKSVTLYDGFLRERQTQTSATGGGRMVSDTFYTSGGAPDWTSSGYYDKTNAAVGTTLASPQGQIPAITAYNYDGVGREIAKIFKAGGVEKWRSTTSYGGDRVHVVPPTGETATTMILDVDGQTSTLLQYKNPADVGSTDPSRYDQTSYTYTLLGQLKTVVDQAGVRWTNDYDLRGRQIQAIDPDRGTIQATYDDLDRPITSTAPLGTGTATLAFTYDALGRRTSVRDDSSAGALRAAWTYDTAVLGKGKLATSTRYSGINAYVSKVEDYDAGGQPLTTSVSLPAGESSLCAAATPSPCVYTSTATYKPDAQLATMTRPAAADLPSEKLVYGYTDVGEEGTLLSAAQVYLYSVGYDKLGQLTQRQFGAYGSRVAVTSSYDEPTRRAVGLNVVPELKAEAANYQYEYDKAGNVTKITDAPSGQTADTQCYGYDYLSRLAEAWTPGSGTCASTPAMAGLGGPAPYWRSWTFDSTGNRRTETRHGSTDLVLTSTYPTATAARPHAVTGVTATGAQSWTRDYAYDNGGNTTSRPNSTGGAQTLTYNREGALETVVDGSTTTRYLYDADGNRLLRTDGTGKTLYLPDGTEVRYDNATGTKKATRYYTHKGDTIAARNGNSLYWLVDDHHGTAELAISAVDLSVAKRRTLPYGEQRGPTAGAWPAFVDKGFVGGTADPTGLTHLGAREYDPVLGRFLSGDRMSNFADPQQINGYAYANNSPSAESDADGLCWPKWLCSAASKAWGGIKSGASAAWGGIKKAASWAWGGIKKAASWAWGGIKKAAKAAWNGIKKIGSGIKKAAKAAWKWTRKTAWPAVKRAGKGVGNWFKKTAWPATKKVVQVSWQSVRTVINLPATAVGWGWAEAHGASCGWNWSHFMNVCSGASGGYGRGGMTIGSVYITGNRVDDRTLRHEEKHADQYAMFGGFVGFPIVYGLAEWASGGEEKNWFERGADLEDGCYKPRPGC